MFKFLTFIWSPKFYFLDTILRELENNFGYFIKENDLVEKVTKDIVLVKGVNFIYSRNKPFIDANNETYFVRYACQYLSEQNLIKISSVPIHDVQYSLTYSGLITIKTGGLLLAKIWLQLKTAFQYAVWLVAIFSFVVNYISTQKYNMVSAEVYDLKHKIDQSTLQYEQKLKQLQLQLKQPEKTVKKDTVCLKPHL